MIDEDELDEVEEGWWTWPCAAGARSTSTPLDRRSKRVQLEHNELSTLPKTIGTLEFMWKCDVQPQPLGHYHGRSASAAAPGTPSSEDIPNRQASRGRRGALEGLVSIRRCRIRVVSPGEEEAAGQVCSAQGTGRVLEESTPSTTRWSRCRRR